MSLTINQEALIAIKKKLIKQSESCLVKMSPQAKEAVEMSQQLTDIIYKMNDEIIYLSEKVDYLKTKAITDGS